MTAVEFKDYYRTCNRVKADIKKNHGVNIVILPFPVSKERLTLDELADIALEVHNEEPYNKNIKDIRAISRKKELVNTRHVFCYFATMFGYDRVKIGEYLRRHHSTVIHALRFCSDMIDTNDIVFGAIIKKITKKINKYVENISDDFKAEVNTEPSVASLFNEK